MYQIGHGAQDAIEDGWALADNVFKNKPDMDKYSSDVENRRQVARNSLWYLYLASPTQTPNGLHKNNTTGQLLNKIAPINTLALNQINERMVNNKARNVILKQKNSDEEIFPNETVGYRDYDLDPDDNQTYRIRKDVRDKLSSACNAFIENQKRRSQVKAGTQFISAAFVVGALIYGCAKNKINYKVASGILGGLGALNFTQKGTRHLNDIRQAEKMLENEENKLDNAELIEVLYRAMMASNNDGDSLAAYILREFDGAGNTDADKIKEWNEKTNIPQQKQAFMSIIDALRARSVKARGCVNNMKNIGLLHLQNNVDNDSSISGIKAQKDKDKDNISQISTIKSV